MEYSKEFEKIVENSIINEAHIGTGNPNAKILFIGQEAAYSEVTDEYKANAEEWKNHINDNKKINNTFPVDDRTPYLKKTWGKNTWSKYQKLHDYIYDENTKPYYVNFLERVFTTEMSDNPAKNNSEARKNPNYKSDLKKRKDTFFNEDFIQNFNVVVLACSGYIVNNEKNWEINNLFKVKYIGDDLGKYWYNKTNWFYIHYSEDKKKMVIHTRQLSTDVFDKMLEDMGKIIREHLIKNSLL